MAKKLNKGLAALKKERPDVVANMGFKKGGMTKKGYAKVVKSKYVVQALQLKVCMHEGQWGKI